MHMGVHQARQDGRPSEINVLVLALMMIMDGMAVTTVTWAGKVHVRELLGCVRPHVEDEPRVLGDGEHAGRQQLQRVWVEQLPGVDPHEALLAQPALRLLLLRLCLPPFRLRLLFCPTRRSPHRPVRSDPGHARTLHGLCGV